jgi:hypothetical protein
MKIMKISMKEAAWHGGSQLLAAAWQRHQLSYRIMAWRNINNG